MPHSHRLVRPLAVALLPLVWLGWQPSAAAEEAVGCDAKRAQIEHQLEQARTNGQTHRAAGLERALEGASHCTPASLLEESQEALADLEKEHDEQREELAEATADGDHDDVAKHQRKLDELTAEIERERTHQEALKRQAP